MRKRGRPKRKIHCLTKSPPRPAMAVTDRMNVSTERLETSTMEDVQFMQLLGEGGEVQFMQITGEGGEVQEVPGMQEEPEMQEVPEMQVPEMQEMPRAVVMPPEMVVPTQKEAEVLLKGLQEAVKGKLVACSFCGSEVSPKSIKRHQQTQKCREARLPTSAPLLPSSTSAPSITPARKRTADMGNTRTKRSRAV